MRRLLVYLSFAVLAAVVAGCADKPNTPAPTTPSQPITVANFTGSWASTFTTSGTTCGKHDYTITPTGTNSASVTYDVTCGNYNVKGTGNGTLSGSTLGWNASGTVSVSGGVSCPFTFKDSTATLSGNDQLLIAYNATVCGVTYTGTQTLTRK